MSCAAPSTSNPSSNPNLTPDAAAAPVMQGQAGANAFGNGNNTGGAAAPTLAVTFIDDGGIALLADGGMIYVKFVARPCPGDNALTYENFGAAFFASYCQRCHSAGKQGTDRNDAPPGLNFDDLPTIRASAQRIWGQAGDSNATMPAGAPKPSPDERAQLGAWLACGAPGSGAGTSAAGK